MRKEPRLKKGDRINTGKLLWELTKKYKRGGKIRFVLRAVGYPGRVRDWTWEQVRDRCIGRKDK
jgi:hypothetical protein